MGSWGYRSLESDIGLDILSYLNERYASSDTLMLSDVIETMKGDYLGTDVAEIDYLYDNTAIALAELFVMFKDTGSLDYDELRHIKVFSADRKSLDYILAYLTDINNTVPDDSGIREIVELWKDSKQWYEWRKHIDELIVRIQKEQLLVQ